MTCRVTMPSMQTIRSLPPLARSCLATLAMLAAICWLGPLFTAFDPHSPDWDSLSVAPGVNGHWFGTDAIGRDVFARTLAGGRLSLTIGLAVVALAVVVSIALGLIA